jgi:hypothetical protein
MGIYLSRRGPVLLTRPLSLFLRQLGLLERRINNALVVVREEEGVNPVYIALG